MSIYELSIDDLIEQLDSLTVMDAVELARKLEKRWGVSSAIRIQIFDPHNDKPVFKQEQFEFDVILVDAGSRKIDTIKTLRSLDPSLGLKEAKDAIENTGCALFQQVSKEFALRVKARLENVGATITLL